MTMTNRITLGAAEFMAAELYDILVSMSKNIHVNVTPLVEPGHPHTCFGIEVRLSSHLGGDHSTAVQTLLVQEIMQSNISPVVRARFILDQFVHEYSRRNFYSNESHGKLDSIHAEYMMSASSSEAILGGPVTELERRARKKYGSLNDLIADM